MSNYFEYVASIMPQLLLGLKVTLQMTVVSLALAVVVGMASCMFSISKVKPLNWISGVYLSIIRGTPLMVQSLFIYFGLTAALDFRISIFKAAVIVLCLNAGAYLSEIFRSGIAAVNKGQMEAGRSLGLDYASTMRFIIVPQAFKNVLPALGNELITLLKETSIVTVIGLRDLTKGAMIVNANTYQAFVPFLAIAAIYLLMVMALSWLLGKMERRLRQSDIR